MRTYTGSFRFNASVDDVYACLTNPYTIELWSGYPALMPAEPGEEFSILDGDISGILVNLVPGRLIEQHWFFGEERELSPVKIVLREKGGVTEMSIEQKGIPEEDYINITEGWEEQIVRGIALFLNPNF